MVLLLIPVLNNMRDSQLLDSVILPEKPAALQYCTSDIRASLIVSTYQLEGASSRNGSFFFINQANRITDRLKMSAGVFRFEMIPDNVHVIASLTNGCLSVVDLQSLTANDLNVAKDAILLSVSVNGDQRAVTSDDHGRVHIVDIPKGNVASFEGHRLSFTGEPCEVWNVIWHNKDTTIISGGEDGELKVWDTRCLTQPIQCNKSHGSGVVFLRSEDEFSFISGSYDEYIRRFDSRKLTEPVAEQKLQGGVWSVQEVDNLRLLSACMYGGWALLERDTLIVIEKNTERGQFLLYGASYSSTSSLIASCTFNNYAVNFDKVTLS